MFWLEHELNLLACHPSKCHDPMKLVISNRNLFDSELYLKPNATCCRLISEKLQNVLQKYICTAGGPNSDFAPPGHLQLGRLLRTTSSYLPSWKMDARAQRAAASNSRKTKQNAPQTICQNRMFNFRPLAKIELNKSWQTLQTWLKIKQIIFNVFKS